MEKIRFYKLCRWTAGILASLALCSGLPAAPVPAAAPKTSYYDVVVGGQPAGLMTETERVAGGRRVQETSLKLVFQRAGLRQGLTMATRFEETLDGKAIEAWARQELGTVPIEVKLIFGPDTITVESRQGESVRSREAPNPPGWLTPGALQTALVAKVKAALKRGGERKFSLAVVDPLLGPQVLTSEFTLEAQSDPVKVAGKLREASRWRQTQSIAPQVATLLHFAADGEMLQSRTQIAGLDMVMVLRDGPPPPDAPPAPGVDVSKTGPPELLLNTLVHPDRPLESPRQLRRAIYDLNPEIALPSVGYQQVVPRQRGVRVIVDLDAPAAATEDGKDFLSASIFLNHEHPKVLELHGRALPEGAAKEPAARAETLRSFVQGYLQRKDLRSVLATASEVAVNASGDCTEHAVLLAALLRADRIPARVAFGLIYIEEFAGERNVFGYHLWTQALIDGRWVDLDATLRQPFDAAHLTLGTSALDEELTVMADMTSALDSMSKVRLRIVSTR
jgi:hypothetical protein